MGKVDVLDNIKRCSLVSSRSKDGCTAAVVEYVRRRLAKRDHAPLG